MKSNHTHIRKTHMEQLYHTTELIGIKDKNIKILFILKHQTHLEIKAKLDYDRPWLSSLPRKVYQVRLSKVVKDSDFGLSGLSDPPLA